MRPLTRDAKPTSSTDFPILFDVVGLGSGAGPRLSPAVPRVQFGRIFECPHPCGLMPLLLANGSAVNGGTPMRANLSLHLAVLERTFAQALPNVSVAGLIDFDFESWNPVWQRNDATYQNATRALVRAEHPGWSAAQVEAAAQAAWESSATRLLAATAAHIRLLRPNLRVGMYGLPTRFYYHGYDTDAGPALRRENDALFPLWCSLDAIFVSVYQFYNSCSNPAVRATNRQWVAPRPAQQAHG